MNNNIPLISICILQYNNHDYLKELLDSLLISGNAIFTDKVEVVILNDCSPDTDIIESIINEFKNNHKNINIRYYKNKENVGILNSRLKISEYARGKYIRYMDGDDLLCENGIDILMNMAKDNNYPDIIEGNYYYMGANHEVKKYIFSNVYTGSLYDEKNLLYKYLTCDNGLYFMLWNKLIKREILLTVSKNINHELIKNKCCLADDICLNYYIYKYSNSYIGDASRYVYIHRVGIESTTGIVKYVDMSKIDRYVKETFIIHDMYNDILSLKNDYSEQEYDELLYGFRRKIFSHHLTFKYGFVKNIEYGLKNNIILKDDLNIDKINKIFNDGYKDNLWYKYLFARSKYEKCEHEQCWRPDFLLDYFGESNIPLISICILQYNNEDYVEELLESLIKSSKDIFTDKIEVVILNDCSPRSELLEKIINNFKSKYPKLNLRYYKNKENIGILNSRLKISEYARGKYIRYMDGDDLLCENGIDILMNMAKDNNYPDIIETSYKSISRDRESGVWKECDHFGKSSIYDGNLYDEKNLLYKYLTSSYLNFLVWTKCVKRDVLLDAYNKIPRNARCCMGEDLLITFMIYSSARSYVGNVKDETYIYRENVGISSIHSRFNNITKNDVIRTTNGVSARLVYEYLINLNKEYSEKKYSELVDGYRKKIFRNAISYDLHHYNSILYSVSKKATRFVDMTLDDFKSIYTDIYGEDIFNKSLELKQKCCTWFLPKYFDWFGEFDADVEY